MKHEKYVNPLLEGIEYADEITTVSETYAKEILSVEEGKNLTSILTQRKKDLTGIVNGIDDEVWNPADDSSIKSQYDVTTVAKGKSVNKKALQKELGLPVDSTVPLFGFIGRLDPFQKGIDILIDAVKSLLSTHEFQVVILGKGSKEMTDRLIEFSKLHTKTIIFVNKFDEPLSRRIYAGCDCMIIPSRYEPCGLVQLIAKRYGSIPLVRKTGGLSDTVKHEVSGFVFSEFSKESLTHGLQDVIVWYKDHKDRWDAIQQRIMKEQWSWKKSAKEYIKLYRSLMRS